MSTNYAATHDMEEAPFIPTHGEFKLDSGYTVRQYIPVVAGTQDTDEESNKYWVLPYTDTGYNAVPVGITMENRYKTGYIDYDIYSIADGIGGYAPDIRLAVHGGPIPMLNYCAAATVMRQKVSPHPSGFTDWAEGQSVLGYAMEHAAPTGEQCLIYLDISKELKTVTENLTSPDVAGDDPIFNASYTPLTVADVFDVTNQTKLYPGDPTATTKTYSTSGTGFTIREEDSITGLVVTYTYDPTA